MSNGLRKVHHSKKPCQSKNRHLVTDDWEKVTCRFCLNNRNPTPELPLPKGIKHANKACRCGECYQCRARKQNRK